MVVRERILNSALCLFYHHRHRLDGETQQETVQVRERGEIQLRGGHVRPEAAGAALVKHTELPLTDCAICTRSGKKLSKVVLEHQHPNIFLSRLD